jgi:hypothetical protein
MSIVGSLFLYAPLTTESEPFGLATPEVADPDQVLSGRDRCADVDQRARNKPAGSGGNPDAFQPS